MQTQTRRGNRIEHQHKRQEHWLAWCSWCSWHARNRRRAWQTRAAWRRRGTQRRGGRLNRWHMRCRWTGSTPRQTDRISSQRRRSRCSRQWASTPGQRSRWSTWRLEILEMREWFNLLVNVFVKRRYIYIIGGAREIKGRGYFILRKDKEGKVCKDKKETRKLFNFSNG